MAATGKLLSYARIGLFATAVLLAASLVAGAWLNYRSSREAVATLYRGQAEVVEAALRSAFPPWEEEPDSAALVAFMDSFPEYGIRYMAVVDGGGNVRASIGSAVGAFQPTRGRRSAERESEYQEVGDRVRLVLPLAGVFRAFGNGDRGGRVQEALEELDAVAEGRIGGPPVPPVALEAIRQVEQLRTMFRYQVVEFEPVVANTLVTRSARSLGLAIVSASILTLAALLFWRTAERYAADRARMEEQRRLSVLGEMSAVMAHEIRNPLASLKGTAQLLAERLPEGSRDLQRAERIVSEAVRLETLTTDLLDFARSGPITTSEIDPARLLRESVEEVGDTVFELDTEAAPSSWRLDDRRLRHALVNILQNAAQAVPAAAPPRASVRREAGELIYEIRDFGPGIPSQEQERLFEPFYTTRTNGTGLGLAVAQRVAEIHGGRITASNHPQGGAVFRIHLPPIAG